MADNTPLQGFSTRAIHTGEAPNLKEGGYGDVVIPIHLSTTYARNELEHPTSGYEYTRSLNPTRHALEEKLASLELATFGLAFASGLAAESTIILSLLKSGDHIVAFDDLYGGTKRLINKVFVHYGISVTYVDATQPEKVRAAIRPETKMIWLETPTNPLLKICDIKTISTIARTCGAVIVVDNTFLSPFFQNPLEHGADVVVHSSTKYLGGHSDVLGGAIMLSDEALYQKLKFHQNAVGAVPSPFDCYLTMRGIKTLELRMIRHQENALQISRYLEQHQKVEKVIYPGLENHPQYALSQTQTKGSGGMLSFLLKGKQDNARTFLQSLQVFALAESLGGVESLIEHPATMTHASVSIEERQNIGISDTLVRISAGIENAADLLADLDQALTKC